MTSLSNLIGKLIVHGQLLLIYPAAFETRQERLANYEFPSDLPYEDVELTTSDRVKLKCILLRASQRSRLSHETGRSSRNRQRTSKRSSSQSRATAILFHGNGYHVWHHAFSGERFVELGCDVLLVSYRGYGHSGGSPSEKGLQKDSQAALDYVLAHPELKKKPIIIHGHSLGGAVSIDLVRRNPDKIHGIILENTFLSIPAVAKDLPGVRHVTFAIHQTWESERRIAAIPRSIPILMFSGARDEVVPPSHMQKLWDISRDRHRPKKESGSFFGKLFPSKGGKEAEETETVDADNVDLDMFRSIPDGTHADTWVKPGYWSAVEEFLTAVAHIP